MNWKRACSTVLFTISLAVLAVSGYELGSYLHEEAQSDSLQRELAALRAEDYVTAMDGADETENEIGSIMTDISETEIVSEPTYADAETEIEVPDIEGHEESEEHCGEDGSNENDDVRPSAVSSRGVAALNAKNPDCVAWITIEGTVIDYPVMYKPDHKDYYLHRDFNGRKSSGGTLYISEICNPYTSDNVIIYGHHMSSGKMFAALDKYKKRSFYEEHRYIIFETLEGVHIYEVIFALTTPVYTGHDFKYYSFANASGPRAFDSYISACAARALYDTGVTTGYGDRLLTLSTCEYSQNNGRMLVVAKRID